MQLFMCMQQAKQQNFRISQLSLLILLYSLVYKRQYYTFVEIYNPYYNKR